MARTTGIPASTAETGNEADSTQSGRLRVQALEKGLAVLSVFDVWHREWTVDEIANQTGLPKMNVYRLLKTMEEYEFAVCDPATGRYHLGPAICAAGYAACHRMEEIIRVTEPYLQDLAKETEESVALAVEVDGIAVQIASVQGSRPYRALIPPGRVAHYTSHAKLFAALKHADDRPHTSPAYAHLPRVVKDSAGIAAENETIRAEGLAWDLEDRELGACAVAAPIRDQFGDVVASITIVAPPGRFQPVEREVLAKALKRTAASLSRYFGYLPPESTAGS